MISDYQILGASGEPVKISFGRGTIKQAYDDRTVGGVNFGYDEDHDFGAIYIEGKLYSPRVLDIELSDNVEHSTKNVKILYVDNEGYVQEKTFETTDRQLIDDLISVAIQTAKSEISAETDEKISQIDVSIYKPGDYISIEDEEGETGNYIVSVRYDALFQQIKDDLQIEDEEQDERLINIEHEYTTGIQSMGVSEDERTETFKATMKSRESKDERFVVTETEFSVPTDHFYETLDSSIADIYDQLSKKTDWQDVHDLLNQAEESE